MWWILLAITAVAAMSKAVMDSLAHNYKGSIFNNLNPTFWDPKQSWKNKYKYKSYIVRTLMSTIFVMFTDAWHLFQFFAYKSLILLAGVSTFIEYPEFIGHWWVWTLILMLFHQSVFHFSYSVCRRIPLTHQKK